MLKRRGAGRRIAPGDLDPPPARAGALRLWMAAAWLGALAVVAYGLHQLEPYARCIKLGDTRVEWVNPPGWLADENWQQVLPQLEARISLHPDTDPFDDQVCPYVAAQLSGSSWIAGIRRITKQTDGRVRIHADFRKPFALVEKNGLAHLVDDQGVRLPEQWPAHRINRSGWWVIQGVTAPVPQAGAHWPGADLDAGLSLARFLYRAEAAGQMPFRSRVRAIDVSNFAGQVDPRGGRLRLVTGQPRGYIHWGLPPGEEYGIEIKAELKLARLRERFDELRQLPDGSTIDVRWEKGIGIGAPE